MKNRNTFLFRLITATMVVVLVTVMAVSLLSYANIEAEVSRNEVIYYRQRFQYNCDLMEQQVFSPLCKAYQDTIILDSWVRCMRQLTESSYSHNTIVSMKKLLQEKITTTDCLVDAALYCPSDSFIISGLSGVNFLKTNGTGTSFDVEWIHHLDQLSSSNRTKWLSSRSFPPNLGINGNVFSLACYYAFNSKNNKIVYLCYSVSCDRFEQMLSRQHNEGFFMVDDTGNSVLGTGSLPAGIKVTNGLVKSGDAVYLMQRSASSPWYYVMTVPGSAYSQYKTSLRTRFWVASLVIFCVMSALSLRVINRLTSPFAAMLERARSVRSQQFTRRRNDLLFVADTFDEVVNNAEEAQRQLDERLDSLKNSFLLMLLHGRCMEKAEIAGYLSFLKLDLSKAHFAAVILQNPTSEFELCDERFISEKLREASDERVALVGAGVYGRLSCFIVNCDDMELGLSRVNDVIEAIHQVDYLSRVIGLTGCPVDHLTDIGLSYRKAEEHLEKNERPESLREDNPDGDSVLTPHNSDCADRAVAYLQSHYAEDITIQDVADDIQVSRSHLSRIFKEAHGMTMLEYLMGIRLSHAMDLLGTTSLSVNEISEKIGFNNSNYFYRKFKEKFGCTPMQFRQNKK